MNRRIKKKKLKEKNKLLIKEYPFLKPKNVWSGKELKNYDYTYTLLDDMPEGWKKAFGELLCEDLKKALIKDNYLEEYSIFQVKEKYGTLRWYDNGGSEKTSEVINKYEHISEFTCVECGKVNVPIIDEGWIQPMCECCYNRHSQRKIRYGMKPDYKKAISCEAKLTPTFKMIYFSNGKENTLKYDCTDILNRMGFDISFLEEDN